jgi:hypothetical protein
MTESDSDGVPDFIARISDALRFVFAQDRDDIVVLVGDTESGVEATDPAVRGHTRIRRISDTFLIVL